MRPVATFLLLLIWFVLISRIAVAGPKPEAVRLEVLPGSVRLAGPGATQRLLVTAVLRDGSRRDVTDEAKLVSNVPKVVAARGGEVSATTDGAGTVRAVWRG